MKWNPISELEPDKDVLFRIEFGTCQPILYVCGCIWRGGLYIDYNNNSSFENFDGGFLCKLDMLYTRNIHSIRFVDPKEIEL